ncbi:MAG: hypothetical protein LQ342_003551 [Letrouitia transgressa]|nr:MAG: hypothetical protein LQ342_003551 [Letrouitia transgressa]
MRQCLTSPEGGYYTHQREGRDQFGQKGDFITSPEISQIFGELLGIWLVAEWMGQGRMNHGVEIIEMGPGRGTLMDDMLRTISRFKDLASSVENVFLVEASPSLRNAQKQLLCGEKPLEETEIGFQCMSKHFDLPITWCEDLRFVPNTLSKTPFIVAHEFFDALPIHAFQSVPPSPSTAQTITTPTGPISLNNPKSQPQSHQWRELLVNSASPPTTSPPPGKDPPPEFELTLSKSSTPPSLLLPTLSPRYRALLSTSGATIEISSESQSYAADFAQRIGGSSSKSPSPTSSQPDSPLDKQPIKPHPSGAALILDYGPQSTVPTSTLRGIRSHALCSPFIFPGLVDLSADVDFTSLADAALGASEGVEVHGPVEQGDWLLQMGARERAEMICKELDRTGGDEGATKEMAKKRIRGSVERLMSKVPGKGMGGMYKVLAIVPERGGRRPMGFGGGLGA